MAAHTVIPVLHRDGSNYKIYGVLVATGAITPAEVEELNRSLDSGTYYLPLQVNLDFFGTDWASYGSYDDDHPWHEMLVDRITVAGDGDDSWFGGEHIEHVGPVSEFVRRIAAAAAAGWRTATRQRLSRPRRGRRSHFPPVTVAGNRADPGSPPTPEE